jgi:hypothetical protein
MLTENTDAADTPVQQPDANGFEVSLAPREGHLLSLPFDQYGRMRIAQNIAHALYSEIAAQSTGSEGAFRLRVLDVGGYPGIMHHFLAPEYFELSVLDVVPDDGSIPGYTQGSGMELPFGQDSFDVVFSLDTLEHIPAPQRDRFLSELMRVARLGIVIINPIQSLQADLAEETLDEYIRWILDAQQEQLAEHRAFGLPDFAATTEAFHSGGWRTHEFRLANVYNWLLMMIAKHYLISMRDERATAFEHALDRYYNLSFYETDRNEPTYRGAIVAVQPGLDAVLQRVSDLFPATVPDDSQNAARLGLTQVLMELLNLKAANHEDKQLREQMERRDRHIAQLEQRAATQDIQLDRRRVDIENLNAELQRSHATIESITESMSVDVARAEEQVKKLENHIVNVQNAYTTEFANQKDYIARLEAEVRGKDEHILYLERLLQGLQSGRVFQLTRTLSRFIGRR